MQYPKIMQPTHARWERVSPTSNVVRTDADRDLTNGSKYTAGLTEGRDQSNHTIFHDIPAVFTRNFMITDTYYTTPSASVLGYPGPDADLLDVGPGGLTQMPEHAGADLPEDCRLSFDQAKMKEREWKESWATEHSDGARAWLDITYNS